MTTLHPARKRLLLGVLLLAACFFYAFAPTCGLVGRLIGRASAQLLGQTGSTLLALTMLVVGLLLVIPHGAIGGFFRWAVRGREARVAKVVREGDREINVRRIVADAIRMHVAFMEAKAAPAKEIEDPSPVPAERRRLDDVRSALKNLGYLSKEYETIVKGLDPKAPLEILVKDALKQIRN